MRLEVSCTVTSETPYLFMIRLHRGSSGLYTCNKCRFNDHSEVDIKLCLLVVDTDLSTMVVRVSGENGVSNFKLK
jgi:hypothetical protein